MRRAAALRAWGVPVIWVAGDEPPAKITATAEAVRQVTVVHVHRHLHLTHGGDAAAGLGLALPPGSVVTTTEEE